MNIEKDLQQSKPFKSHDQRALVNLFFTSRYIESKLQKIHKEQGLTLKQYNILRILRGAGKPISTQLIRERMIDRMSDISRIVDRMLEKKLVSKCVNSGDKRLVDISLTDEGSNILKIFDQEDKQPNLLQVLTEAELIELNRILDKIRGYN